MSINSLLVLSSAHSIFDFAILHCLVHFKSINKHIQFTTEKSKIEKFDKSEEEEEENEKRGTGFVAKLL